MDRFINYIDKKYHQYLHHKFFQEHKRVVMYFAFGSFAALVDLSTYLILFNYFGLDAVYSTILSIFLATIVGFILNAFANFRVNDRYVMRFLSYTSVSLVGMFVSSFMLHTFHNMFGFDGNVVKIVSLPIVFVVQYLLNSNISFRKTHSKKDYDEIPHVN